MELHFLTVSTGLAPGGPGISRMQIFMSKSPPSRVWHDLTFIGVIGGFYGIKTKDRYWAALTSSNFPSDCKLSWQSGGEADQGGGRPRRRRGGWIIAVRWLVWSAGLESRPAICVLSLPSDDLTRIICWLEGSQDPDWYTSDLAQIQLR